MSNIKTKKKKPYDPFMRITIKTAEVGKVKCYCKAVRPNPKDAFGTEKVAGNWYNEKGHNVVSSYPHAERYDPDKIYFYDVVANDGSYRKCATEEESLMWFAHLIEFEKRQTEIG